MSPGFPSGQPLCHLSLGPRSRSPCTCCSGPWPGVQLTSRWTFGCSFLVGLSCVREGVPAGVGRCPDGKASPERTWEVPSSAPAPCPGALPWSCHCPRLPGALGSGFTVLTAPIPRLQEAPSSPSPHWSFPNPMPVHAIPQIALRSFLASTATLVQNLLLSLLDWSLSLKKKIIYSFLERGKERERERRRETDRERQIRCPPINAFSGCFLCVS